MKNYITIILILTNLMIKAQDIIVLKDGNEVKAMVAEISSEQVKYRKFDNDTGVIYTIEKSKILMVKYQNGTKDIFTASPSREESSPKTRLDKPKLGFSKIMFGRNFTENGIATSINRIESLMQTNPDAFASLQKGNANNTGYYIGSIGGGVLLGWGLGKLIAYDPQHSTEPNNSAVFIGIGAAGAIAGFIMYAAANKHYSQAVQLYNQSLMSHGKSPVNLYIGYTGTGIGAKLSF